MNVEQYLDNQLEHFGQLSLIEKVKAAGALAMCGALAVAGGAVVVMGMFILPDLLMELF